MSVKSLTKKALNSIKKTGYLNVWEGAVRSSKTVTSELAWINYLNECGGDTFIMSGKTLATLHRNVIASDFGFLNLLGNLANYRRDSEGNRILEVKTSKGIKKCYCFGANDESSFQKVRGLTAEGWYADEVNLQPRSFVEECLRRTIVSSSRKHFWTLNPDNPNHYIYTDYLDKYEDEQMVGFYLWKFTLDDNLAISPERKEELKKQYSGVFYRRYILGERVLAEGVIYDMFNAKKHIYTEHIAGTKKRNSSRYIAIDYGTTNPCVFLEIFDDGDEIWVDREYRWDSRSEQKQKTDGEYLNDLKEFAFDHNPEIIIDPSASSFRVAIANDLFYVREADNDVINGIRTVANLFSLNKIHIHESCKGLIRELTAYAWDEKAALIGLDKPVKQNDHAPDALRYFCYTILPSWRTGVEKNSENNVKT